MQINARVKAGRPKKGSIAARMARSLRVARQRRFQRNMRQNGFEVFRCRERFANAPPRRQRPSHRKGPAAAQTVRRRRLHYLRRVIAGMEAAGKRPIAASVSWTWRLSRSARALKARARRDRPHRCARSGRQDPGQDSSGDSAAASDGRRIAAAERQRLGWLPSCEPQIETGRMRLAVAPAGFGRRCIRRRRGSARWPLSASDRPPGAGISPVSGQMHLLHLGGENGDQGGAVFDLILPLRKAAQSAKRNQRLSFTCPVIGILDVAPQRGDAVFIGILHVGLMLHQSAPARRRGKSNSRSQRDRSPRRSGSAETRQWRQSAESPRCAHARDRRRSKKTVAVGLVAGLSGDGRASTDPTLREWALIRPC